MIDIVLARFEKQPAEEVWIKIDWSERLESGESITSHTVSAIRVDTNASAPEVIGGSTVSGTILRIKAIDGSDGVVYKITARVTTSNGNIYESDVFMQVKSY